jgi:uncharacterized protein YcnI
MSPCRARVIVGLFLCTASMLASAHVTVWPRESRSGAYEKYVVRVPTEGKVATESVELQIPEGVSVVSMAAPAGYTYELNKVSDRTTGIVWKMRINPGEFAEFAFMARNPTQGKLVWKAVQHFVDGTKTEWTGASGDKHPASVTTLVSAQGEHAH